MSFPHRAAGDRLPGRTGGIADPDTPPRPTSRPANRLIARLLLGGGALAMLAAAGLAASRAAAQDPSRVTVQPGETLSSIALRHYGDAAAAGRIALANRIADQDRLLAGTDLQLPPRDAATPTSAAGAARRATVQPGETLTAIALRVYGSADYAGPLAAANGLAQPDLIRTGQEIALPASLALPGGRGATLGGGSTVPLAARRICIDPGHGGIDSGAAFVFENGRTLREADVALDMSLALAERLRAHGAIVSLTRQADLTLDLSDRAARCNATGAEATVSVHLNGVENRAINGSLTLFAKPGDRPLAQALAGVLHSGLFGAQRADATAFGARPFEGRVLLYTRMPAVIVEPSFLSNPVEARALLAPASDPTSRRAQIVRELERGLMAYLR